MFCTKKKFKTEKEAEIALEHIKRVRIRYRREKHPIRHYECPYCKKYHLTSQLAPEEDVELVHLEKFLKFIMKNENDNSIIDNAIEH